MKLAYEEGWRTDLIIIGVLVAFVFLSKMVIEYWLS